MKVTFRVNQAAALRRGIDAPHSTVTLTVDPATLIQDHRDILAAAMSTSGHEAFSAIPLSQDVAFRSSGAAQIVLDNPSTDGLYEELERIAKRRSEQAAKEAAEAEEAQRLLQAEYALMRAMIGTRQRQTIKVWIVNGKPSAGPVSYADPIVQQERELPVYPDSRVSEVSRHPLPEDIAAAREAAVNVQKEAVEALFPLAAQLWQERQAKKAEQQAAIKAEYDALYARLPSVLRERDAAGYTDGDEIDTAIKSIMRQDAGYQSYAPADDYTPADTLSNDEYAQLKAAIASAPQGATVKPYNARTEDVEWCGTDGVWKEIGIDYLVADVRWTIGGVVCEVDLLLSPWEGSDPAPCELATDYQARRQAEV